MTKATLSRMVENRSVRQRPEEGFRRWFLNKYFDVILWYSSEGGQLKGFQFCYGKPYSEHAYTWDAGRQSHHRVSDSRSRGDHGSPAAAVLQGDSGIVPENVIMQFCRERGDLPADVMLLIVGRLRVFNRDRTQWFPIAGTALAVWSCLNCCE